MVRVPISILRLFASHDLPLTNALLRRAGVWRHEPWRLAEPRSCRGRWHGYRLTFDLRDFHQRGAYLFGRLLDVPVQLVLRDALRPGDAFIDVGANIGALTLQAARAVGPRGIVRAFEPNPDVFARLEAHVRANAIANVRAERVGLSDRDDTLTLSVPITGNTGAGSLGGVAPRHADSTRPDAGVLAAYRVPVRTGDDLLADSPSSPMLIKIDVEGHETHVLRGLAGTIRSRRPAILTEINPEMLACNGSNAPELITLLRAHGYQGWLAAARWRRIRRRWDLRLHPAPTDAAWSPRRTLNALFLDPAGVHATRLAQAIASTH